MALFQVNAPSLRQTGVPVANYFLCAPESIARAVQNAFVKNAARTKCSHANPEQCAESFLLEMPVVGQSFGDALAPHSLHRNAIRQAVTLVGPGGVERHAREK